jgi:mannose-6-phosphate isomerase
VKPLPLAPVVLPANQPRQFYRGGAAIAELRGDPTADAGPEDWVASTTARFGAAPAGLTALPGGALLRDAVAADPVGWLGAAHVAEFGADTALLVKLLDAGQRLPVHCHPSNGFAASHLDCRHGKTEAWLVIGTTGPDPTVHAGFRSDVPADVVARWVDEQDGPALLGALNPIAVRPGDAVFVPAGLPHAIGAGVFIVELQQPTDFSVTLEWRGFLPDPDGWHLGLGRDAALTCVDRMAWSADRLSGLIRRTGDASGPLLPADADPFFRADRVRAGTWEPSFAVLVVLAGSGELRTSGGVLPVRRGSTVVVPFGAGEAELRGDAVAIRCRPPLPGGGS